MCQGGTARGARKLFSAEYALSVTGIAGPGGGSLEKPVGLAVTEGLLRVARHVWDRDRIGNKAASVEAALEMLIKALTD
ncbi:MAG: CinA family protein [Chloroflexi bacterium]|nr:CinA family protein [Chloroflexota bacterium]